MPFPYKKITHINIEISEIQNSYNMSHISASHRA